MKNAIASGAKIFTPELAPISVGRAKSTSAWSMQSYHYHNTVELYYLFSGSRFYFIEDKSYYITEGDLVTVVPGDLHATAVTDGVEYDRLLISVTTDFLREAGGDEALEILTAGSRAVEFSPKERKEIEALMLGMERECADGGSISYLKGALVCLCMLLSRKSEKPTKTEGFSERTRLVAKASAIISSRFSERIGLGDLAKELFVSPSYLSRVFGATTGMSLTEYINAVKIKEAERLLASTVRSVADIAEAVGYSSLTHFDRVFKAQNGMTPNAFRLRMRGI